MLKPINVASWTNCIVPCSDIITKMSSIPNPDIGVREIDYVQLIFRILTNAE